jgi:hypothetical protein
MCHLKLCGSINPEEGDNRSGKNYKKPRTRQEECGIIYHTESEGRFRFVGQGIGIESERICRENWQKSNSFRQTSKRASRSGKIAGHLIADCHNRLDRNNRQMLRNEQNIKFLKEQVAQLEQEQADLALENEALEARIVDLEGIEDQMVE